MIIYHHDEIMIKNYLSIRYMDDCVILVEMSDCDIKVKGEQFVIIYYDNIELRVKGKIKVIEYHESRV